MRPRVVISLLPGAFRGALANNVLGIAKGAAFSAALSLFPGLIFLAALFFRGDAVETVEELSRGLGQVLPPGVHTLLASYLTVPPEGSTGLMIGAGAVSVLFGADLMISLMEAFRKAYGLPRNWSFWKEHIVGIGLVFLALLPIGAVSVLMLFGRQIETWLVLNFGDPWWLLAAFQFVRRSVAVLTITLVVGILYHVAPERKQSWRKVWPGAVLAALLWLLTVELFTFYVQNLARYSDLYGNVATVVVLLIWLYLASIVVMVGCEFNVGWERQLAAGKDP